MKNWFCEIRGASVGPLDVAQIQALHASGELGDSPKIRESQSGRLLDESEAKALLAGQVDEIDEDVNADRSGSAAQQESCESCGRTIKWTTDTCPYCGHDSSKINGGESASELLTTASSSLPTYVAEVPVDNVDSLGAFYRGPVRLFASFVRRLDWGSTAKQLAYIFAAFMAIFVVNFLIDLIFVTGQTLNLIVLVVFVFGVFVPGLIVIGCMDFLLLGVGFAILKGPFPGPERTIRSVAEVIGAKLIVVILYAIGAVFLLPWFSTLGELGIGLRYLYFVVPYLLFYLLPTSIYGQRLSLSLGKSSFVAFLTFLPQLLFMIISLALALSSME